MDCKRFEEIQTGTLLGDVSAADRKRAAGHARDCEPCREAAERDSWLEAAFAVDDATVDEEFAQAHDRLAGVLEERRVCCDCMDAPFGKIYLARSAKGLCLLSFRRSEDSFLRELEENELLPEFRPSEVAAERRQLRDYFNGRLTDFDMPVDLRLVTPFQRKVLQAASRVPFGSVVSYGDIARRIGKPQAHRAVGGALGRNPVPIVVPCHRIVAAGGGIGGYTGGLRIKRSLMEIEGIRIEEARV